MPSCGHLKLLFAFAALLSPVRAELRRLVVLARHGNRAPNAQVPWVCPTANHIVEQFREPTDALQKASLSRVGLAENWEAGNFLKKNYKEHFYGSEDAPWADDGTFFSYSERMNRNIVSMNSLMKAFYPDGTGESGYLKSRPNLVPIFTSQPSKDTLINLPRDGPCLKKYKSDMDGWAQNNTASLLQKHGEIIAKFSKICGVNYATMQKDLGKDMIWGLKAATDLFNFAHNEGIDITDGGKFDAATLNEAIAFGHDTVNAQRFGAPHQPTYWLGQFVEDALLANIVPPPKDATKASWEIIGQDANAKNPWSLSPQEAFDRMKMLVFLNHRELMQALSMVFGYVELLASPLPAGGMILWELHHEDGEDFIITKAWRPSSPDWNKKHDILKRDGDFLPLYDQGSPVQMITSQACGGSHRCTAKQLSDAFHAYQKANGGTWQEICNVVEPKAALSALSTTTIIHSSSEISMVMAIVCVMFASGFFLGRAFPAQASSGSEYLLAE